MNVFAAQPTTFVVPFRRLHRLFGEACLFNPLLAFWALWHCRHARPPDLFAVR